MRVGQGVLDLGQGLRRSGRQVLVSGRLDQARAQGQRIQLFVGKGQRRQVECRFDGD